MASGLAGIAISYDKMVGCAVIGGINVVAMIIQGILLTKVYKMMPNLAKTKVIVTKNESNKKSFKENVSNMNQSRVPCRLQIMSCLAVSSPNHRGTMYSTVFLDIEQGTIQR